MFNDLCLTGPPFSAAEMDRELPKKGRLGTAGMSLSPGTSVEGSSSACGGYRAVSCLISEPNTDGRLKEEPPGEANRLKRDLNGGEGLLRDGAENGRWERRRVREGEGGGGAAHLGAQRPPGGTGELQEG